MRSALRSVVLAFCLALLPLPALAAPAMWVVRDGDSKLWLMGSMHVLPRDASWYTELFGLVLHLADKVYFECNLGLVSQLAMTFRAVQIGQSGSQSDWTERFSATELADYDETIAPLGLSMSGLAPMPPWLAEIVVAVRATDRRGVQSGAVEGVELQINRRLPLRRKGYLESAAMHMDLLGAIPLADQLDSFRRTIATLQGDPSQTEFFQEIYNVWVAGDLDGMATLASAGLSEEGREVLLYQRNRNWLAKVEKLLAGNHQDLIIVGAAHLVGEGSLIDLLQKAGFTVTRIQ